MATEANNLKQVPLPKNTMVVARQNGRLYVVDFTEFPHLDDPTVVDWDVSVSKLIIGKIQQSRRQLQTLEEIECENIVRTEQFPEGTTKDFQMTVFGTMDGKNQTIESEPVIATEDGGYVNARCRLTAKNFEIQLRGTFNVNTLVVTMHPAGRR
jgi:hypothetical protein